MNKAPSLQWYPDKWLADTRRLSWKAKGLYFELLNVIWMQFQQSCSIPDDEQFISKELGCSIEEWQEARAEIMIEHRPLMELKSNRLFSNGLLKEYAKQQLRREHLAENGRKGGRPKSKRLFSEKPNESRTKAEKSLPSPSPSSSPTPTLVNRIESNRVVEVNSSEDVFNPEIDPVSLALTLTDEIGTTGEFFKKALIALGDREFREVCDMFRSERAAGEEVRNKGAVLTAKLKKFMEAKSETHKQKGKQ